MAPYLRRKQNNAQSPAVVLGAMIDRDGTSYR
jgi:hypothetical protein